MNLFDAVDDLKQNKDISLDCFQQIMAEEDEEVVNYLCQKARSVCDEIYGKSIYIRGLIEISNICKNNCFYCGIRGGNCNIDRYRLNSEEIVECCHKGYELGFRTFVFQGGEDASFSEKMLCELITKIKAKYPECAITLSLGEHSYAFYKALFEAGADRYLLRHETADKIHYQKLHPDDMSYENRIECLHNLKDIGYQVGCGFMVGSPFQTIENLYSDIQFIKDFNPHMVGIGPFIPHKDTPFGKEPSGTLDATIKLLAIIRLMNPAVLLPATTALATLHEDGRNRGILAGANVIMPNLSPESAREKYTLYNNKVYSGVEAAEQIKNLRLKMNEIGYNVVTDRGDYPGKNR